MLWDLFAKVVDNHGDIGFAWRLAADLAGRGETVRVWVDAAEALAWMAPGGAACVSVGAWCEAARRPAAESLADVVVETFGCGLPADYAMSMAHRSRPPVWVDVQYLSAETYVERSHGLPSPRAMPNGTVLTQWYFYPGFARRTGGLLHEPGLADRREGFDRAAWLEKLVAPAQGRQPGERVVSLFCYDNAALPDFLADCRAEPTLLLATAGAAARQIERHLGPRMAGGALRAVTLPPLSQIAYDGVLWASDLNVVRGEDSFVRAQWAGVPFLWHIYPQADGAHRRKLEAFLDRFVQTAAPALGSAVRSAFRAWNGMTAWRGLPNPADWTAHCRAWCDHLEAQPDLTEKLQAFVRARTIESSALSEPRNP